MRLVPFDDFGFRQAVTIPQGGARRAIAAGIAPSSDVDLCEIGGHTLAPGGLVPCQDGTSVRALRGYRTGSTTSLGAGPPRISSTLVLVIYEEGDVLVPPGPRAPRLLAARLGSIGATAPAATNVFRLNFMGRAQAAVYASRVDTDTTDATLIIRGVRYLTPTERANDATPDQGYITEITKTLWEGAAAQPTSVITATDKLKGAVYIGGQGDLQESFDELEVWIYGTATPGVNLQAEVFGERGR